MELKEIKKNHYRLDKSRVLKKEKNGWRIIFPIHKDLSKPLLSGGNINYKVLLFGGTFSHLLQTFFIFGLLFFLLWSYQHDIRAYQDIIVDLREQINEDPFIIIDEDLAKLNITFGQNITFVQKEGENGTNIN